jgi:hypothetical protein
VRAVVDNVINFIFIGDMLKTCTVISFSKRTLLHVVTLKVYDQVST